MKLFDRKGRPVEVPDDQVHDALSSGEYGAPKGTRVPVRMDGRIGTVPIERLGIALDGDATVIPQSAYDAAKLQAEYGDAGHGALALGTEALDTATLGASNAAIRAIGGKGAAQTVRKSQEANPFATGVGTAVGIVGPVVADVASAGTLTPALAAGVAGRTAARGAEGAAVRAAEGGIAKHLAERVALGADIDAGLSTAGEATERAFQIGKAGSAGEVRIAPRLADEIASVGPSRPGISFGREAALDPAAVSGGDLSPPSEIKKFALRILHGDAARGEAGAVRNAADREFLVNNTAEIRAEVERLRVLEANAAPGPFQIQAFAKDAPLAAEEALGSPIKIGNLPRARAFEDAAEATAPIRLATEPIGAGTRLPGEAPAFDLRAGINPNAGEIRALPHSPPKVKPFTAREVAEHRKDLGITPSRRFEMVPISDVEAQATWEPGKLDSLRNQLKKTGKIDPVRLTRDGSGPWVIEDGIHRTALAREMGMTHVPAVVTEYRPVGAAAKGLEGPIGLGRGRAALNADVLLADEAAQPFVFGKSANRAVELGDVGQVGSFESKLRPISIGPPGIAPEIEAEIVKDFGSLGPGRAARALPPGVAGDFEAVGAQALRDVPEFAGAMPPRMLPPAGLAPEVAAAEEAARVGRVAEAAQVVEQARAAGAAAERAAAEATGKGVIRQTVEGALFGPTRAVNFAGQMVEDAVRGVLGREAETALGRIAQDALVKAARGATEGGIYGLGNEVGHQFLQDDPDLSAERLSAAWFNGALLGGGFGAATGALGRGAKEAIGKVVGNEGISKFLSDKAGEHMWHAAGGTKKMAGNAQQYAGGTAKVGNLIREDAQRLMGRTPGTREELLELSQLMQKHHGGGLDAVFGQLDDATVGSGGMKLGDILKKVERAERELKDRAAPHQQLTSFKERIIDALEARDVLTGEVAMNTPVTFKQLRDFRRTADEASKFESTNPNAVRDSFRQLRHSFESEIEAAAEPHITKAGGSLLKDYKAAKAGYQAGKLLEKAAGSGVAANQANQFTSLTDKLFGLGAGAVVGHGTGPVGGFLAHQMAGYASKQFRKNFDFVVSDVLTKLASISKGAQVLDAAQAANVKVQKRMDQGLKAVRKGLDGKEVDAIPLVPGPKTYEERVALVKNLAAQHEQVMGHLNDVSGPLGRSAPNVAGALNTTALRTLTFLVEAIPKPPKPPKDNLTPKAFDRNWEPSDPQKAAFNRRYTMAAHPELAPALVAVGAYTVEHDQALLATHPKMKSDMGAKLRAELDKRTKAVPPGMRPSVKLFLGVPSVDKELGRMMQSNYQTQDKGQKPPKPLKINTDNMKLR